MNPRSVPLTDRHRPCRFLILPCRYQQFDSTLDKIIDLCILLDQFGGLSAEQAALDAAEEEDAELVEDDGKEQLLAPDLVQNLLVLAASLPEGSTLVYDGTHGFGWEDPTFGWMVYFGKHLDQPELRLKIYQTVAATFLDKQRQPVLISVAYLHAPYYRMEP